MSRGEDKGMEDILKGSGHYWKLLKIVISIKPFLVASNGELLIVLNIVRNGSL